MSLPSDAKTADSSTTNEPEVIIDKRIRSNGETVTKRYLKGRFLGKGGFARCHEVRDMENKVIHAAKIVAKNTLTKARAKQKLMSEIKIHCSLAHTNVVRFEHFFEDDHNVYILLEMCGNQTLNELLRRRKRLTEVEVQVYMIQLINGLKYLHRTRVIHRDLKLGNLFLSDKMELKIGDFGLATKLAHDGERKRTICGTPNYIAPEILDGKDGHSYEVDIWSLGVICYTLLVGKPPFETADVKSTYRRIKRNAYSFPPEVRISEASKALVRKILHPVPTQRPTLDEILSHEFFQNASSLPRVLPLSTLNVAPSMSALLASVPSAGSAIPPPASSSPSSSSALASTCVPSGPVSASGSSSSAMFRQPLMVRSNQNGLSSALNSDAAFNIMNNRPGLSVNPLESIPMKDKDGMHSEREKPLTSASGQVNGRTDRENRIRDKELADLMKRTNINSGSGSASGKSSDLHDMKTHTLTSLPSSRSASPEVVASAQVAGGVPVSSSAFAPAAGSAGGLVEPDVWVKKWVDYSSKYGLGYLLSDGSTGVFFNDNSKIILSTDGSRFEYVERRAHDKVDERFSHTLESYPSGLQKKVTLLKHFKSYLLGGDKELQQFAEERKSTRATTPFSSNSVVEMPYVKKWMRTRHAVMFRLSNKIVQVNFLDQTEIILSSENRSVVYVNKRGERSTYPLLEVLDTSNEELAKRLKYTKDILVHMLGSAGAAGSTLSKDKDNVHIDLKLPTTAGTNHMGSSGSISSNPQLYRMR
eukprot:GILJ01010256.1.p1 GENE.GILJ01010256.1~~GILJ01010256.1.p1  ORF type:complete len:759 (-),score=114.58 GILJ01010256.1:264-2540(-)